MNAANITGFATGVKLSASSNNSSDRSKDDKTNSMDFLKLVNESMAGVHGARVSAGAASNATDPGSGAFRVENTQSQNKMPEASSSDTRASRQPADYSRNAGPEKPEATEAPVSEESMGDLRGAMKEIADGMEEVIVQELDASDEDFLEAMEVLGLNFVDLLNTQNLGDLTLQMMPEDLEPAALTDLVGEITQAVADVVSEALASFDVPQEDFTSVVTDLQEGTIPLPPEFSLTQPEQMDEMPVPMVNVSEESPSTFLQQEVSPEQTMPGTAPEDLLESQKVFETVDASPGRPLFEKTSTADAVKVINIIDTVSDEEPVTAQEVLAEGETEDGLVQALATDTEGEAQPDTTEGQSQSGAESRMQSEMESNKALDEAAADRQDRHMDAGASFQNQINQTVNQATQRMTQQAEPVRYTSIDVPDIMNQIVTAASTEITDDVQRVEMTLNPQNLGRMIMQVQQQEGAVTARLIAQNAEVKEALEAQLAQLRENLQQKGIKVDAVEISAGTHEFERNLEEGQNTGQFNENEQQEQQGRPRGSRMRNLNRDELEGLQGVMSDEEELAARIMRDNGNSVDYSA